MHRLRPTRVRYIVLAFTVAVYMITYMDRVVISNAAPVIQKEFGFSLITMGWILASFRCFKSPVDGSATASVRAAHWRSSSPGGARSPRSPRLPGAPRR